MLNELLKVIKENNFNESEVSLESNELIDLIISLKRYDLIKLFDEKLFTSDNLLKIIENSENEGNITFLTNYKYHLMDKEGILQTIINKGYYNIANVFFNDIKKSTELFDVYLNNIDKYNSSFQIIKSCANDYPLKLFNALNDAKRYDLIALLLNERITLDNDLIDIINKGVNEIIQYLNTFKLDFSISLINENPKLFEILFLNGFSKVISCSYYFGSSQINALINNSEIIRKKIIDYLNTENDEYIKTVRDRAKFIFNESSALYILLNRNILDYINEFKSNAWNIENQLLCIKLIREGKIKKEKIDKNALLDYYVKYDKRDRVSYSQNIYDTNNIRTLDNAKNISKLLETTNDKYIILLYKFVVENKSDNICRLVYALLEGDINNAKKLIDDKGITSYFESYLKYDRDYILNNNSSISDMNSNYLLYKELVLKYSNNNIDFFNKYLMINDNSIDLLINNGMFTRYLIELLLNPDGINILSSLLDENYKLDLTEIELSLIDIIKNIPSEKQKEDFINYYNKNKSSLSIDNLYSLYSIFNRINNTNSFELRKQADNIIPRLLLKTNPMESYEKLEYTLTSGCVPEFYKRFVIYKELYGDTEIKDDSLITSPVLKNTTSREEADKVILSDLLNISVANNSQDLFNYLNQLNKGNELYLKIITGEKKEVQKNEIELLHDYRIKYEYIADYVMNLKYDKTENDLHTIHNIEKAYCVKQGFPYIDSLAPLLLHNLMFKDIFKIFPNETILRGTGAMHSILRNLQEEIRDSKKSGISIEQGDFIKGINSDYLENILSFGILSKEFLGEDSQTDMTHLDTDMSLIEKKYESIKELMQSNLIGTNFGDMSLLLSRDYMEKHCNLLITKDEFGEKKLSVDDYKKMELFKYNGNHYCIRTGVPSCCIKGIIATKNFDRTRFLVSKGNNYIPIYDKEGNLLYSFNDYENDKAKMAGLSYYEKHEYILSKNLINEDINSVLCNLQNDIYSTKFKRDAILKKLQPIFDEYFLDTRETISNSVLNGTIEIYDTGSTGRNTNIPNDGDFDFILRIDRDFINSSKFNDFVLKIYNAFGYPKGDTKVIRLENVKLEEIDEPLKIEMTIIDRNSKMDYSTDMCLKDRLNTIQRLYPNDYNAVKANIIFAKEFFKKAGIYKINEHGFGGVGIENFILQHGGSFIDAIEDFLKCSDASNSFQEFKRIFHIYDYGKNHFAFTENNYKKVPFPYDDYASFLDEKTYEKMKKLFREYLYNIKERKTKSEILDLDNNIDIKTSGIHI